METMLSIKFVLFALMEIAVVGIFAAVLVAAVYQIVRDRVQESRRQDGMVQESGKSFRPVLK
ncbi:MAG: hypothetical protein JXA42_18510 [Anaerolineales bacterium]|nr:hypothetical protein [Anaerolineales bacterium]